MPRLLTYNVHRCVGVDRKLDVARIVGVIAEHEPDIVCLQELDVGRARTGYVDQAQEYKDGQWHIRRTPKTVAGKAMNEVQWREFNRNVERLICEVLCVDEATLADAMTDYLAPNYRRAA